MNPQTFQRCSPLCTDTAQAKIEGAANKLCRERHEGLDDGTKNSDFPVKGEVFPLTSPFIERSKRQCLRGANIRQVRNAPEGFVQWATQHGAVTTEAQSDCQ